MPEVAAREPDMYPLVDVPQYTEEHEDFADLRECAEAMIDGLNHVLSWFIFDETDEDWGKYLEPDETARREFSICFAMPRKSSFLTWTTHSFERAEVEWWITTYLRPRVLRWYGWV
jgi:hypothetical protein